MDEFTEGQLHRELPVGKVLAYEEALNRQLDRIAFLRSTGQDWSEALYQLRDMLVGQEDEQFFDGVPEGERERIKQLPEAKHRKRALEEYSEMGWDTHSVPWIQGPRGPIFRPTNQDLSHELRLIMGLLSRKKMLQRTRHTSRPPEEAIKRPDQANSTV